MGGVPRIPFRRQQDGKGRAVLGGTGSGVPIAIPQGQKAPLPLRHRGCRKKFKKLGTSVLTPEATPDYIRLTNDSGDAAGDEEVRFCVFAVGEIKRAA